MNKKMVEAFEWFEAAQGIEFPEEELTNSLPKETSKIIEAKKVIEKERKKLDELHSHLEFPRVQKNKRKAHGKIKAAQKIIRSEVSASIGYPMVEAYSVNRK